MFIQINEKIWYNPKATKKLRQSFAGCAIHQKISFLTNKNLIIFN